MGPEVDPPGALAGADRAADGTDGTGTLQPDAARCKQPATWQARAALKGHQLRRLDDGRWLAWRHAWSREMAENEVEAWLQLIGAPG